MMGNRHWMPTDSRWKSDSKPSTTRSGEWRKKGVPRRTGPTATARASRTEGNGKALATDPTSVRLVASSRSPPRQYRAARGEYPPTGVSATPRDDDTTAGETGRPGFRRRTFPQSYHALVGGAFSMLSGLRPPSHPQRPGTGLWHRSSYRAASHWPPASVAHSGRARICARESRRCPSTRFFLGC